MPSCAVVGIQGKIDDKVWRAHYPETITIYIFGFVFQNNLLIMLQDDDDLFKVAYFDIFVQTNP